MSSHSWQPGRQKIDVETGELILKFKKETLVFNAYEWTPYMEDLETCYQLKEKGSELHQKNEKRSFHRREGIPSPDVF